MVFKEVKHLFSKQVIFHLMHSKISMNIVIWIEARRLKIWITEVHFLQYIDALHTQYAYNLQVYTSPSPVCSSSIAAVAILLMGFSSSGGSEWLLSIESMLPASEMDSTSPSSSSNGFGGILGAVIKREGS